MRNVFNKAAVIAAVAGLATVAFIAAPNAYAGSKTANFDVTLTIQDDCSISANPLNFGSSGVINDDIDQTSTLSVSCTKGTAYNVALDQGTATGSTVQARQMANAAGTGSVAFNLYRDAARTQLWGQTTGSDTASGTGNGLPQSLTVYGRVPSQDTPAPGTYSSTVTATVVF